jgi:TRAP transporter TAXI family solute receptor
MDSHDLALLSKRDRVRVAILFVVLIAGALWVSFHFLQAAPPRHIVLASGPEFGVYHQYALRYKEILRREGVSVDERMTNGAAENLNLLLDPKSGVEVAFMQGGVAPVSATEQLEMLASLYYEPLWIFYRDSATLTRINELHGKRIAIGVKGSGTYALASQVLSANGLTLAEGVGRDNTDILALGGAEALDALKAGKVDAALFVGGAQSLLVQRALGDPLLKLMSVARADAYPRRFPFMSKLTLPPGTIDLAHNIPAEEVQMIGTKAMLIARDGLHPAIINLLIDAAREIHGAQGYFEAPGEFPGTAQVDIRVSEYADQHKRFGPSFLYRYLPFWLAAVVERTIIVVVPLLVVLVPLINYLPQFLRWRVRSRIYRWYGELAIMERDVANRTGPLPIEQWLRDLERIERAVEEIKTPTKFASEAYTLREHIALVRRSVLARADAPATAASPPPSVTIASQAASRDSVPVVITRRSQ